MHSQNTIIIALLTKHLLLKGYSYTKVAVGHAILFHCLGISWNVIESQCLIPIAKKNIYYIYVN
jgi:hypothetical protein